MFVCCVLLLFYMSWGIVCVVGVDEVDVDFYVLWGDEMVVICDLVVMFYMVFYDVWELFQFVFMDGNCWFGVLMDVGMVMLYIMVVLSGCDVLVFEFNYDIVMLVVSCYLQLLKVWIGGNYGYLSNDVVVEIFVLFECSCFQYLVVVYLSQQNNLLELVCQVFGGVFGMDGEDVIVVLQDVGFDWLMFGQWGRVVVVV